MNQQEFEQLVGCKLNAEQYNAIEHVYATYRGRVDSFCESWKKMDYTMQNAILQSTLFFLKDFVNHTNEHNALSKELSDVRAMLNTANNAKKELESEVSTLTEKNEALSKEYHSLTERFSGLSDDRAEIERKFSVMKTMIKVLKEELSLTKSAYKQVLNQMDVLRLQVRMAKDQNYILTDEDKEIIAAIKF